MPGRRRYSEFVPSSVENKIHAGPNGIATGIDSTNLEDDDDGLYGRLPPGVSKTKFL